MAITATPEVPAMAVTWALVRVWYLTGFWGPATSDAHLMGDGIATSAHFTRTQDLHEHTISRDAQTFFRYDEKYEFSHRFRSAQTAGRRREGRDTSGLAR